MSLVVEENVKEWKKAKVESLIKLIQDYNVIAVSNLYKVREAQVQELRRKFRGDTIFTCTKNVFIKRALAISAQTKNNIEKLSEHLQGSTLLIFTNLFPAKLSILFAKSKIKLPAKAGDIAQDDVVVPEGNTGMPPGPVISEFTELGLPTKIESGSIWITRDTTVVKKSEEFSYKMASALTRLGIKPIEAGLSLTAAYDNGLIYTTDVLKVDLNTIERDLQDAVAYASKLALNTGYITEQTLPALIALATGEAKNLSLAAEMIDTYTLPMLLAKSYIEMLAISGKLSDKDAALAL